MLSYAALDGRAVACPRSLVVRRRIAMQSQYVRTMPIAVRLDGSFISDSPARPGTVSN